MKLRGERPQALTGSAESLGLPPGSRRGDYRGAARTSRSCDADDAAAIAAERDAQGRVAAVVSAGYCLPRRARGGALLAFFVDALGLFDDVPVDAATDESGSVSSRTARVGYHAGCPVAVKALLTRAPTPTCDARRDLLARALAKTPEQRDPRNRDG